MFVFRLHAKVECDAAQREADQHQCYGQVKGAEHDTVCQREGDEEYADAENQPGLVGIPEWPDRGNHRVFLVVAVTQLQ